MSEEYYTESYLTEWKDRDNVIISMWKLESVVSEAANQVGVVELTVYKNGEHEGEALVWNLYVDETERRKGLARELMNEARKIAKHLGAHACVLEWSLRESPNWVFDWYCRLGYEEKEFGPGCSLMELELKKAKK